VDRVQRVLVSLPADRLLGFIQISSLVPEFATNVEDLLEQLRRLRRLLIVEF
jgi:hypothetical protein